ncbi:hypothetical protein KIMH_01500 [Bombiscardovia apis]|uniref:Uncharacterized protein n=1 Tax=Bombiscardovia apis TaxID=2932182 RepID=A0ABM8BB19_9BIFI|nr:hypothetical protein KIMH_01500 [Bombiscardovia apis]
MSHKAKAQTEDTNDGRQHARGKPESAELAALVQTTTNRISGQRARLADSHRGWGWSVVGT